MANTENKCHQLIIGDEKFLEWDLIFTIQGSLQTKIGCDFENMTLKELADFFLKNKHALEDELSEMMDALGGINDGIGSAAWKWWKADNKLAADYTIEQLTSKDRKELLFEIVDAFHFMINFAIACKFTGSDIANAYIAKNKENFNRQNNGY